MADAPPPDPVETDRHDDLNTPPRGSPLATAWLARWAVILAIGLAGCASAPGSAEAPTAQPGSEPNVALTRWQPLHPLALWRAGASGDSNSANRGAISNLLALREGATVWLIGSGASPAQGRALAEALTQQPAPWGAAPREVISPWPRPELVLGQAGMPEARSWAHAEVAKAMGERCPRCVERLKARLGQDGAPLPAPRPRTPPLNPTNAEPTLDAQAIRIPESQVVGDQGQLGPLRWWRLSRGHGTPVTVWWHPASHIATAHGLLWSDGAPDLRDSDLDAMLAATDALVAIQASLPPGLRWLPEQGPVIGSSLGADSAHDHGTEAHRRYWLALREAVNRAQADGRAETDIPTRLPGIPTDLHSDVRHSLNWQRAWRQSDEFRLDNATDPAHAGVR